jgi:hypothetical protein
MVYTKGDILDVASAVATLSSREHAETGVAYWNDC